MKAVEKANMILSVLLGAVTAGALVINFISGTLQKAAETYITTLDIQEASDLLMRSPILTEPMLKCAGKLSSAFNLRGYYNNIGIYITDDKYIMSDTAKTTTNYEVSQTLRLKEYLDERGINLLYVNLPVKYVDDTEFLRAFGKETYSNRNTDLYLQRITEAGVPALDLRREMEHDGLSVRELFYRTDHHWTVPAGLWAAGKIAGALNQYAGYHIDPTLYEKENYTFTTIPECWTGEQGIMVSEEFVGYDDYTYVLPDFPTSFYFKKNKKAGDFTDFILMDRIWDLDTQKNRLGMHYAYKKTDVRNELADSGKVLLLCDSYANAMMPFLALGIKETDVICLREPQSDLQTILDGNDYDTVLICYAQFMIGAHDDKDSANYKMFSFFGD